MSTQTTPTVGRTVRYVLSSTDCDQITARRKKIIAALGTEIEGNPVTPGQIVPATIMVVWDTPSGLCNLQVSLDGYDSHWATLRHRDDTGANHTWHWPAR